MCGFQDALSNIMPVDWLDPYGHTPFAKGAEMSVDITIVETDDGIRATSVKNPPRAGSDRLMNAIKNALGVGFMDSMEPCETDEKKDVPQKKEQDTKEPEVSDKKDEPVKEEDKKPDFRTQQST